MANDFKIGAGLQLDGEKQFKDAVKSINKELYLLGTETKKVTAQFNANSTSLEALTSKNDAFKRSADEQRKKIEIMTAALEDAKKEYGENSDQVRDWQIKINKAETDLAKTEKTLNETTEQMENFGKESKDGGSAIEKAGKQAGDSERRFDKLGGVLKGLAIGMGTVAVAAGAMALKLGKEVIKSFGELEQNLGGSEAVFGDYADSVQKSGEDAYKNLGVSQSEYLATANKMGALFQGSGIDQQRSLELTETAMQRAADMASVMGIDMSTAMDAVTGAAKGNYTMMDNLGVKMDDTSVKAYAAAKGFEGVWAEATNAQKAEYAMQMFFENTGQYAGNFEKESTQTITGSLGMLGASMKSFVAGLGSADADMKNLTKNMVDAFKTVVKNIAPVISNIAKALPEVFAEIIPAIGALLPDLVDVVAGLFEQVINTLVMILPQLIPVVVSALGTITTALINNLPMIINAAFVLIMSLADGLIQALPTIIPQIVQVVVSIVQMLIDNIPLLIDAALQLITGLAQGMIDALPVIIEALPTLITGLIDALLGSIPVIIEAGITLFVALVGALPEIIKGIVEAIPKIIDGVIDAIINNIPLIIDAGVQLLIALVSNLPQIIIEVVKAIPEIIVALVKGIVAGVADMAKAGLDLIKGLWQGIKDAAVWLWEKIKGWCNNLISKIKDFFGIHSPSTVFAGFGENMAIGLGEGFGDAMKGVSKDMVGAVPTNFNASIGAVGAHGAAGTTYNFYSPKALSMREIRIEMLKTQQRQALMGVV